MSAISKKCEGGEVALEYELEGGTLYTNQPDWVTVPGHLGGDRATVLHMTPWFRPCPQCHRVADGATFLLLDRVVEGGGRLAVVACPRCRTYVWVALRSKVN